MAHWFHPKCFFGRARPKAVGDIAHFDSLRWDDQVFMQVILNKFIFPTLLVLLEILAAVLFYLYLMMSQKSQ
jgi:hypothetical protein